MEIILIVMGVVTLAIALVAVATTPTTRGPIEELEGFEA